MTFLNQVAFDILNFMRSAEGQSQPVHMPMLSERMDVPEDRLHGRQHFISLAVEELRRTGLIADVSGRCWACNRPPRVRRIVVLHLTDKGRHGPVALRTQPGDRNKRATPFQELDIEAKLDTAGDQFWHNLGRLVAMTLDQIPADRHDDLLVRLQDKCSVYGVDYKQYLKDSEGA